MKCFEVNKKNLVEKDRNKIARKGTQQIVILLDVQLKHKFHLFKSFNQFQ